jgi:hypothetical protein
MAGRTIQLHEVAQPEILDPRGVEGHHSCASVPGMFHESARAGPRQRALRQRQYPQAPAIAERRTWSDQKRWRYISSGSSRADNVNGFRFDANLWDPSSTHPKQPAAPTARPASKCTRNQLDDCGWRSFLRHAGSAQTHIIRLVAKRLVV